MSIRQCPMVTKTIFIDWRCNNALNMTTDTTIGLKQLVNWKEKLQQQYLDNQLVIFLCQSAEHLMVPCSKISLFLVLHYVILNVWGFYTVGDTKQYVMTSAWAWYMEFMYVILCFWRFYRSNNESINRQWKRSFITELHYFTT